MRYIFAFIILLIISLSGCDISPRIQTERKIETDRICVWRDKLYSVGAVIVHEHGTYQCVVNESGISFAHWASIKLR